MSTPTYQNIHGRRPGRGLRPYLLVFKLVCVAAFVGGLIVLLVATLLPPPSQLTPGMVDRVEVVRHICTRAIIPGVIGAVVAGLLLLSSIWRPLVRMRWLQIKLVLVIVCLPTLHVHMRGQAIALQQLLDDPGVELSAVRNAWADVLAGAVATLAFALAAAVLGRIKPRFGQDYAAGSRSIGKNNHPNSR